jgi:peptidoglycan/xylan/chitin deacetylase (PgdA/CDA1 family)
MVREMCNMAYAEGTESSNEAVACCGTLIVEGCHKESMMRLARILLSIFSGVALAAMLVPPAAAAESGPYLPAPMRANEWSRLPTPQRVVALTFDAGANADGLLSILSTLSAQGVPATFFLTGRWVQSYPAQAAQIAATRGTPSAITRLPIPT